MNSAFSDLSKAAKFSPQRPYAWDFSGDCLLKVTIFTPVFSESTGVSPPATRPAAQQRNAYSNLVDEILAKTLVTAAFCTSNSSSCVCRVYSVPSAARSEVSVDTNRIIMNDC